MTSYLLILVLSGSYGGGVSTVWFTDYASCVKAGETFIQMNVSKSSNYDYRCLEHVR